MAKRYHGHGHDGNGYGYQNGNTDHMVMTVFELVIKSTLKQLSSSCSWDWGSPDPGSVYLENYVVEALEGGDDNDNDDQGEMVHLETAQQYKWEHIQISMYTEDGGQKSTENTGRRGQCLKVMRIRRMVEGVQDFDHLSLFSDQIKYSSGA